MRNLRLTGFAVASLVVITSAQAQHLGARQQWQPQTESDPRLQQPAQLEIIGRAAVTGLPILSEKTGVMLTIAPEDLTTVGERKFTVIAKGCTLKAIMVQLCEALQECHWDVEGEVYLLHRNTDAETAGEQQGKEIGDRALAERREVRTARVEAARAALKMTPEELAELEKTEPILGRAARDTRARELMDILFALPGDQFRQFSERGGVSLGYLQAPERMQKAAEASLALFLVRREKGGAPGLDYYEGQQGTEGVAAWKEHLGGVTMEFADHGSDFGFGVRFVVSVPLGDGRFSVDEAVLPPRYLSTDEGTGSYLRLLQDTGSPDHDAAWEIITKNEREGFSYAREKLAARRKAEWVEPTDPELLKVVTLEAGRGDLAEIQKSLAQKTGLSVISDYFTQRGPWVGEEMAAGLPLWRTLYLLGDNEFLGKTVAWRKVGGCLVFRDVHWHQRAQTEVPESLVVAYREKLKTQGQFTLDDLAAFAVALGDRSIGSDSLPEDLARAGLRSTAYARTGLRFYASLSPEQVAAARRETGLPYAEMSIAQRQQMAEVARRQSPPISSDALPESAFRVIEERSERKRGEKQILSVITHFQFQYPERKYEEGAILTSEVKTQ